MSIRTNLLGAACAAAVLFASSAATADEPMTPDSADPVKLYAGIGLMSAGGVAVLGGGISYFALSATTAPEGEDPYKGAKTASILSMVLGGAGLAAGLPLILTAGPDDVASENDKGMTERNVASLKPTVRVGVGAASASWRF